MRDEVLNTIYESEKALNPMEIMNIIKPENTVSDYEELISTIEKLCQEGLIRLTSGNGYVKNELMVGTIDEHMKGNAHVLIRGEEDLFINKLNMNGAHNKDRVLVDYANKDHTEGKVVRILKRSLGRGLAEVIDNNGTYIIKPLDDLPYHVVVDKTDINLVDGLIVHLDYEKDLAKGQVLAKVDYVIGHKNAVDRNSKIAMIEAEFGRRMDFPQEVLDEAKNQKTVLSKEEADEAVKNGRVDLRGETITTIDGKDTKDIDDAISSVLLPNGNYLITVPIADVSHYVKRGSKVWEYAELKGNSDYPGDKVGPMLPIEYSNGICSLNPNEDKFALTVQYELTPSGEKLNPKVFKAVIKSKQRMNYDAVQDIIDNKYTEETKDYVSLKYTVKKGETIDSISYKYAMTPKELLDLNDIKDIKEGNEINIPTRRVVLMNHLTSRIMKSALKKRGKIDFDSKESKFTYDKDGRAIEPHKRIQRPSEELIENMMIYANEAFAEVMIDELSKVFTSKVPFVFRTHGDPNPRRITDFLDMLNAYGVTIPININPENVTSHDIEVVLDSLRDKSNFSAFSDKLLRCMQKAAYTPENYGHFGIASELYCHFTSPIRRMADLIIHTMYTEIVYEKKQDPSSLKEWVRYIDNICELISECEIAAEKGEYAVKDYDSAVYMENKTGQTFEATVLDMMPGGFFVSTDECIEGRVDYYLEKGDAEEIFKLEDPNEIAAFVEEYKKLFSDTYEYNEKAYGYSRGGKMYLRYGDKVLVVCSGAYPETRTVDFTMVRKM